MIGDVCDPDERKIMNLKFRCCYQNCEPFRSLSERLQIIQDWQDDHYLFVEDLDDRI